MKETTMTNGPADENDVKLTAYALGELSDAEKAEVEASLAASPSAQAEVEATRAMAKLMGDALEDESQELPPVVAGRIDRAGPPRVAWLTAAAAITVAGVLGVLLVMTGLESDRLAVREAVESTDVPRAESEGAASDELAMREEVDPPLPSASADEGPTYADVREREASPRDVAGLESLNEASPSPEAFARSASMARMENATSEFVSPLVSPVATVRLRAGVAGQEATPPAALENASRESQLNALLDDLNRRQLLQFEPSTDPIEAQLAVGPSPWNAETQIVQIGVLSNRGSLADADDAATGEAVVEIEFNPSNIAAYRPVSVADVGVEAGASQSLRRRDDAVQDLQSNVFYEVLLTRQNASPLPTTRLRYQQPGQFKLHAEELMTLNMRYGDAVTTVQLSNTQATPAVREEVVLLLRLRQLLEQAVPDAASWQRLREEAAAMMAEQKGQKVDPQRQAVGKLVRETADAELRELK